jgi:hypothetical protein
MILVRSVSRDVCDALSKTFFFETNLFASFQINRYNAIDLSVRCLPPSLSEIIELVIQEDVQEDWGWKLVHGEVFRPPRNPLPLSILVGNGAQLCAMTAVTLGRHYYTFWRKI